MCPREDIKKFHKHHSGPPAPKGRAAPGRAAEGGWGRGRGSSSDTQIKPALSCTGPEHPLSRRRAPAPKSSALVRLVSSLFPEQILPRPACTPLPGPAHHLESPSQPAPPLLKSDLLGRRNEWLDGLRVGLGKDSPCPAPLVCPAPSPRCPGPQGRIRMSG